MGKHLPNAPITEALLDIRVDLPPGTDIDTLQRVHEAIHERYPTRRDRVDFQARLDPKARSVSMEAVRNTGFLVWSSDERHAAQVRIDGFSFSRLRPYDRWDSLRDEARRLWDVYAEIAQPMRITRLALRYINKLELPAPARLEDYLTTYPRLSDALPQAISGLFMRVVTEHGGDRVLVSEALDEQRVDSHVSLILDIDAFRPVDIPMDAEGTAWAVLEELRTLKNRVFFGSITSKAEALFQ